MADESRATEAALTTGPRAWLEGRLRGLARDELGIDLARGGADRALVAYLDRRLAGESSSRREREFVEHVLTNHQGERDRLIHALTVRHSWFFRDPAQLAELAEFMVARQARVQRPLEVWVAGCAGGEEAWTFALAAHARGVTLRLLASDLDPLAIAEARLARYDEFRLRELPPELRSHFVPLADGRWQLDPRTLAGGTTTIEIEFMVHNLCGPPPERSFDLISCRNVLIYMTPERSRAIIAGLRSRLAEGGRLALGSIDRLAELAAAAPCASPSPTKSEPRSPPRDPPRQAHLDALAGLAREAIADRRAGEAIAWLEPLTREHPEQAELQLWLGLARHHRGQPAEAIAALRRARLLMPALWPASLFAALAYERCADEGAAQRCWAELERELAEPELPALTGSPALLESLSEWQSEARALAGLRAARRRKTQP